VRVQKRAAVARVCAAQGVPECIEPLLTHRCRPVCAQLAAPRWKRLRQRGRLEGERARHGCSTWHCLPRARRRAPRRSAAAVRAEMKFMEQMRRHGQAAPLGRPSPAMPALVGGPGRRVCTIAHAARSAQTF
jgi:hypothetical protein